MGKKLDALLGRTFKAAKFKPILNLAISRLTILKNQRHARLRHARADVLQLLQIGQHERALLRAEHVIKDQNMMDVYDKIEGYCNLLIDRVNLMEQERECPEELQEAASGLIYAASRCGDFPEIQEIRTILTSRFGKEFAARATELRNNCGVHPQMIQKLSTRTPSVDSRMKALKQIASENNIGLQLEEVYSASVKEEFNLQKQNQPEPEIKEDNLYTLSNSLESRQKYKDVADAAQAAFESAAYAAAAARAAVELSRSEPHDPDDHHNQNPQQRKVLDEHDSLTSLVEDKELGETEGKEFNKNMDRVVKSKDILNEKEIVDAEFEDDPFEKELVFDESDSETENEDKGNQYSKHISLRYHALSGSKVQSEVQVDLEKRPLSVRTR
ncbi:hypothetical protein Lal_00048158 [Lupinus albus]|uniref:Putative vacuolar protein sorting-associated protein Ist1 n=1 Tax=Lupinus albus TaxID=3870 RepID=A0A6A5M786_LUPAL|nr:putative vacuolar protein sorting-associated protein Ist1 [Lupinus albus]KAF1868879.1 hypothetical protein Lal_00048158 [Lupinus albus]